MSLQTAVIITKGACLVIIPTGTVFNEGLKQLATPSIFGIPKEVVSLIVAAIVAGAGGLLAFLSTSFGTYLTKRNGVAPDPAKP